MLFLLQFHLFTALLISGLKQRNIEYSPFSIKRAICATATKLGYVDPFAQGSGLLNVEKAFEHLLEHDKAVENMLRYVIPLSFIILVLIVINIIILLTFQLTVSQLYCYYFIFLLFYKLLISTFSFLFNM